MLSQTVKNLPNYELKKYVVARKDKNDDLWFWGTWDNRNEANRVAIEIGGEVVVNFTLNKEYNIALLEKPLDEGLSKSEVMDLFDMLSGANAIPIEIQGENSAAMGFINLTDAEFMNYDYTKLENFVKSVLNDMNNENDNCEYEVENNCGYSTLYLSRN